MVKFGVELTYRYRFGPVGPQKTENLNFVLFYYLFCFLAEMNLLLLHSVTCCIVQQICKSLEIVCCRMVQHG